MDIVVAILGAIGALFIYQRFQKNKSDNANKEMQQKVEKIEEQADKIAGKIDQIAQKEKEDVAKIEKEQDKDLSGDDLADWFESRNKPKQ